MRILFASEYYFPYVHGGAEVSMANLARALADKGKNVFVSTPDYGLISNEHNKGIRIVRFPFYKKFSRTNDQLTPVWFTNPFFLCWQLFWLWWIVITKKIDIIHIHSTFSIPAAVIAGFLTGKPTVATFRDWQVLCNYGVCIQNHQGGKTCNIWEYFFDDFRSYYKDKVLKKSAVVFLMQLCFAIYGRFQCNFIKFFAQSLTVKICISNAQKGVYQANGFSDVDVIYNTVKFLNKCPSSRPKNEILFQGRLTSGKGIEVFLKAAKIVNKKIPATKFVVAGTGSRFKNSKEITFLGWVTSEKMMTLYRQALLTVLPSVFWEPFGRGALESLVAGTPVVVSNRGGMPEIVEDNVTGLVTDPNPRDVAMAIERGILENKRLRGNIRQLYPKIRQKFEIEPVRQYIKMYRQLI